MEFLTSKELKLNPAGYLISTASKKPVTHVKFVQQQQQAEYMVKLAKAIEGKTFKCGKIDNLNAIKEAVLASMSKNQTKEYVSTPKKPVSKANDELVKFALDFADYQDTKQTVAKINEFMNQFNTIDAIEQVGDYFTEGLVQLNEIYTIDTILKAVQATTEKLD